jgi:glycosyltransferase involved in cell wall biosynthesis
VIPGRVFITWLPQSRRSQVLAASFRAEPIYFGYLSGKSNPLRLALRYLLMTLHTVGFILWRRPKLVFVMNQPVFLPLTVYWVSRLTGTRYVIDSHSGLFLKRQWNWSLPLVKYAYRHSLFSIVTNQKHRDLVASWGAKVEILGALLLEDEPITHFERPTNPSIAIIGSFASDEPTAEVLEACRRLAEVRFFMTGALKNAPPELIESAPPNVTFTDFIPRPSYAGMVQVMDAAMILVKNDDTMQRGAYEAMSWAIPIITSDWPLLRESFHRGTIFVDNTPGGIVRGVQQMLAEHDRFKQEIMLLRDERRRSWNEHIARINKFIESEVKN